LAVGLISKGVTDSIYNESNTVKVIEQFMSNLKPKYPKPRYFMYSVNK